MIRLRNNQQLAYSLQIHLETKRNFTGIYFYLETAKHTADKVEKSILEFIQETYQSIQNDPSMKERFDSAKKALKTNYLNSNKSIEDINSIYWNEITLQGNPVADYWGYAPVLENLEFKDFVEFIEKYLLSDGEERRMVSVWYVPDEKKTDEELLKELPC